MDMHPDRSKTRRRSAATGMALIGLIGTIAYAPPASAGWIDGDITNNLPSSITVKIASFGGGSSWCNTWNDGGYSCNHYWLPSGKADDQIRGSNWDTDGFMIENSYNGYQVYYVRYSSGGERAVSVGTWTRIYDFDNVNCNLSSGRVICHVSA